MTAYGHPGAHAGYATGQYAQQASYGMQHPVGMGRGYPSYGGIPTSAAAAGYGGAAPGAAPGYGYGAAGVPPATHYAGDPNAAAVAAMYSRGAAPGYGAGYGMTGAQQVPVSSAAAATGGYPDYNRMQATQAGQPGAAPGAPQVDSTGAPDYSAYGLGNYQQQDLQYGPARGSSFPSDNSYSSYGSTDPAGYPGAAPGYGGETASFGRGSSASRGFHPYGR